MSGRAIGRSDFTARVFLPLLLLCLSLRAFVPAGWMPAFDRHGVSLVLCSGWSSDPAPAATGHPGHQMGASHHDGKQDDGKSKHDVSGHPCSFAAVSSNLPGPDASTSLVPPLPSDRPFAKSYAVSVGRGLAAPPPPQTGPPPIAYL